ncbi:receptor-like protein kinase 7 [Hevea brasiliensis]|uniref:receptor-like protein kinase 7 n=1 Tax=Hevea brasiliensis TaxID=3981 RepID=UPI0025FFFABB|nr:receptor-like protein kinase 7 [Hevea brasiliensis]
MGWELRYVIAVGATRGLEYLHHGFDRPVIHRDVKSSNILLDEEWKPRIADFGLAKIIQAGGGDWNHINARTHGYMAPIQMLEEAEPHKLTDVIVVKKEGGAGTDYKLKATSIFDLNT